MLAFLAQSVPQGDFRDLPGGRARDVFYQRVVAYLEDHYRTNLSLETLAKANHCSASYLSHMFKAMSGLSLRAYINALRIRDAVVYLENTDMPVSEIAYALGYGDSNYFSTVFQPGKGLPAQRLSQAPRRAAPRPSVTMPARQRASKANRWQSSAPQVASGTKRTPRSFACTACVRRR